MRLLERILVATNFGVVSEAAAEMAIYVAKEFDSKLDIIHVAAPSRRSESSTEVKATEEKEADADLPKISARLDELAQKAVERGVKNAETVLVEGDIFERISSYAESEDVNVIIVGAGEESSSGQVFLGPPQPDCGVGPPSRSG